MYRHYFLTFPDNLFECLAKDHEVKILPGDIQSAMKTVQEQLAAEARDELTKNNS